MTACSQPAAPEPAELEVAAALAACDRWRWMSGALPVCRDGQPAWCRVEDDGEGWPVMADAVPHPRDPATLGCLHALVEDALGVEVVVDRDPVPPGAEPRYVVRSWSTAWGVGWPRRHGEGVTRFVALARALMGVGGGDGSL